MPEVENVSIVIGAVDNASDKLDAIADELTGLITIGAAVTGAVAIGKKAIDSYNELAGAVAHASTMFEDMGEASQVITEVSKKLSEELPVSANDTAEAFYSLGSAGLSLEESLEMIPIVGDYAVANFMSMEDAAESLASIMMQFGLSIEELPHALDTMTKTMQSSLMTGEDLAVAMSVVGGTAKSMGVEISEVCTALSIFAEVGYTGERAGTALRNILVDITDATSPASRELEKLGVAVYDAEGNMRPFLDIVSDIIIALEGMTEEQRNTAVAAIAGKEAMTPFMALISKSPDDIRRMNAEFRDADGLISSMSDHVSGTEWAEFNRQMEMLNNNLRTLGEDILPLVNAELRGISETINFLKFPFTNLEEMLTGLGIPLENIKDILYKLDHETIPELGTDIEYQADALRAKLWNMTEAEKIRYLDTIGLLTDETREKFGLAIEDVGEMVEIEVDYITGLSDQAFNNWLNSWREVLYQGSEMTEEELLNTLNEMGYITDEGLKVALERLKKTGASGGREVGTVTANEFIDAISDVSLERTDKLVYDWVKNLIDLSKNYSPEFINEVMAIFEEAGIEASEITNMTWEQIVDELDTEGMADLEALLKKYEVVLGDGAEKIGEDVGNTFIDGMMQTSIVRTDELVYRWLNEFLDACLNTAPEYLEQVGAIFEKYGIDYAYLISHPIEEVWAKLGPEGQKAIMEVQENWQPYFEEGGEKYAGESWLEGFLNTFLEKGGEVIEEVANYLLDEFEEHKGDLKEVGEEYVEPLLEGAVDAVEEGGAQIAETLSSSVDEGLAGLESAGEEYVKPMFEGAISAAEEYGAEIADAFSGSVNSNLEQEAPVMEDAGATYVAEPLFDGAEAEIDATAEDTFGQSLHETILSLLESETGTLTEAGGTLIAEPLIDGFKGVMEDLLEETMDFLLGENSVLGNFIADSVSVLFDVLFDSVAGAGKNIGDALGSSVSESTETGLSDIGSAGEEAGNTLGSSILSSTEGSLLNMDSILGSTLNSPDSRTKYSQIGSSIGGIIGGAIGASIAGSATATATTSATGGTTTVPATAVATPIGAAVGEVVGSAIGGVVGYVAGPLIDQLMQKVMDIVNEILQIPFQWIDEIINATGGVVKDILMIPSDAIVNIIESIGGAVKDILMIPFDGIVDIIDSLSGAVKDILMIPFSAITDIIDSLGGAVEDILMIPFSAITDIIDSLSGAVKDILTIPFTAITDTMDAVSGGVQDVLMIPFDYLQTFIDDLFDLTIRVLALPIESLYRMFDMVKESALYWLQLPLDQIEETFRTVEDGATAFITMPFQTFNNILTRLFDKLVEVFGVPFTFIEEWAGKLIDDFFNPVMEAMENMMQDWRWLFDIIGEFVLNFLKPISDILIRVIDAIGNLGVFLSRFAGITMPTPITNTNDVGWGRGSIINIDIHDNNGYDVEELASVVEGRLVSVMKRYV